MTNPVTHEMTGGVSLIRLDDGKVNAMSIAMLGHINDALDRAEAAGAATVIAGRPGIFSAGFDLGELMGGDPEILATQLTMGARLVQRLLLFPVPVVTACTGHAFPMGAFIMMSADVRYAAEGPYRIGMNEVAIKIPVPRFALELAFRRLTPASYARLVVTGEMLSPSEAAAAGFVDEAVPEETVVQRALDMAASLQAIDFKSHHTTKQRARGGLVDAIEGTIIDDLTVEKAREAIAG